MTKKLTKKHEFRKRALTAPFGCMNCEWRGVIGITRGLLFSENFSEEYDKHLGWIVRDFKARKAKKRHMIGHYTPDPFTIARSKCEKYFSGTLAAVKDSGFHLLKRPTDNDFLVESDESDEGETIPAGECPACGHVAAVWNWNIFLEREQRMVIAKAREKEAA